MLFSLCQSSAIYPAYFHPLIGHDARIAPSSGMKIPSDIRLNLNKEISRNNFILN